MFKAVKIFPKSVHNQVDHIVIGWGREGKDKEKFFIRKGQQVAGGLGGWGQGCAVSLGSGSTQRGQWGRGDGELSAERWRRRAKVQSPNVPTL